MIAILGEVVSERGLDGAPPLPARYVHVLRRDTIHLVRLALTASVLKVDAAVAVTGGTFAVIMNKWPADLRIMTGSCRGRDHHRGYTCHTRSTATEGPPRRQPSTR